MDKMDKHNSCPSCGNPYGHKGALVDRNSEECSKCVRRWGYTDVDLVRAEDFSNTL